MLLSLMLLYTGMFSFVMDYRHWPHGLPVEAMHGTITMRHLSAVACQLAVIAWHPPICSIGAPYAVSIPRMASVACDAHCTRLRPQELALVLRRRLMAARLGPMLPCAAAATAARFPMRRGGGL